MANRLNKDCIGCGCMEEHGDECIIYTGPDMEIVNVYNGFRYSQVTMALIERLRFLLDQKVSLHCLYTNSCNTCDPVVPVPEAVQILIDKICTLTSADIIHSGPLYCLGGNSMSVDGVSLLGRGYQYFVEPATVGSSFGYDMSSGISGLPAGYSLGRMSVTVSGKMKNGKTVIATSSQPAASIHVENDRFPIVADFQVRVNSPNGTIDMVHTLVVPSAVSQAAGQAFTIKDYAQGVGLLTQETFNALVAAQVCDTKQGLDQLRNLQLLGCDKIQYPNTDIKAIIAVHASELCDILEILDKLNKIQYRECSDECGDNLIEVTVHEAFKRQGDIICDLQQKLKELSEKVTILQGQIQACCDGNTAALQSAGGTYPNSLGSGGSSGGGGGCAGGTC